MEKIQKWTKRRFLHDAELSKRFLRIQDSEDKKEEGESWSVEFIYVKSKIRLFDDETECVHWFYNFCGMVHSFEKHTSELDTRGLRWKVEVVERCFLKLTNLTLMSIKYERIESSNLNEWESVDWKSYLRTMSSCQWDMRDSGVEHKCPMYSIRLRPISMM